MTGLLGWPISMAVRLIRKRIPRSLRRPEPPVIPATAPGDDAGASVARSRRRSGVGSDRVSNERHVVLPWTVLVHQVEDLIALVTFRIGSASYRERVILNRGAPTSAFSAASDTSRPGASTHRPQSATNPCLYNCAVNEETENECVINHDHPSSAIASCWANSSTWFQYFTVVALFRFLTLQPSSKRSIFRPRTFSNA